MKLLSGTKHIRKHKEILFFKKKENAHRNFCNYRISNFIENIVFRNKKKKIRPLNISYPKGGWKCNKKLEWLHYYEMEKRLYAKSVKSSCTRFFFFFLKFFNNILRYFKVWGLFRLVFNPFIQNTHR